MSLQKLFLLFAGCLARSVYAIRRREAAALLIQKHVRKWLLRRVFLQVHSAVLIIQSSIRGFSARRKFTHLREHRAALLIQVLNICGTFFFHIVDETSCMINSDYVFLSSSLSASQALTISYEFSINFFSAQKFLCYHYQNYVGTDQFTSYCEF